MREGVAIWLSALPRVSSFTKGRLAMGDSPQHSSMLPLLIPIRDRLWTTKNCKGQWGSTTLIEPTSLSRIVRFDTDQPEMIAQALKKKTSEIYCSLELSDCILKSLQRLKCFVQSGININSTFSLAFALSHCTAVHCRAVCSLLSLRWDRIGAVFV